MERDGHLVDVREMADLLGLTKQRVHQLKRRADFPSPASIGFEGVWWDRSDVERWAREHPCGALRWGPRPEHEPD